MSGFATMVATVSSALCALNSARRCSFQTSFNFCSSTVKTGCRGKTDCTSFSRCGSAAYVNNGPSPGVSSIQGYPVTGAENLPAPNSRLSRQRRSEFWKQICGVERRAKNCRSSQCLGDRGLDLCLGFSHRICQDY